MAKRICLVDDEKDFTELLGSLLEFNGFEVEKFNDPASALLRLELGGFDAVVADMMMPGMDGLTLIKKLRANTTHALTPIFILTCKQLTDQERTELLTHRAHFVAKPFEPRRLVELIRQALPS